MAMRCSSAFIPPPPSTAYPPPPPSNTNLEMAQRLAAIISRLDVLDGLVARVAILEARSQPTSPTPVSDGTPESSHRVGQRVRAVLTASRATTPIGLGCHRPRGAPQTGSMAEYHMDFARREAPVKDWPETAPLGASVPGMKEDLICEVRIHKPLSVYKTTSLTLEFESKLGLSTSPNYKSQPIPNSQNSYSRPNLTPYSNLSSNHNSTASSQQFCLSNFSVTPATLVKVSNSSENRSQSSALTSTQLLSAGSHDSNLNNNLQQQQLISSSSVTISWEAEKQLRCGIGFWYCCGDVCKPGH